MHLKNCAGSNYSANYIYHNPAYQFYTVQRNPTTSGRASFDSLI